MVSLHIALCAPKMKYWVTVLTCGFLESNVDGVSSSVPALSPRSDFFTLVDPVTVTQQCVSWSLTSLFSTNMAISETKGQGWKVIRTQWRKATDILTSTLAAFLFSSHPKRERDREAHLNYYASAYNRGDSYRITRLKLNRQQHNKQVHP